MNEYVRVYGHELKVGDVVYYDPGTEKCAKLRVEKINCRINTISMSALNENVRGIFFRSSIHEYYDFFIDYNTRLYKKVTPSLQPTKLMKKFKL